MGSKRRRNVSTRKTVFKGKTGKCSVSVSVNSSSRLSIPALAPTSPRPRPCTSTSEDPTLVLNASDASNISFSKISSVVIEPLDEAKSSLTGTVMFDLECLQTMLNVVGCPECHSIGLTLFVNDKLRIGSVLALNLSCKVCAYTTDTSFTSQKHGQAFDINRRLVYAMRSVGCGRSESVKFSSVMNMPPPLCPRSYSATVKTLSSTVCRLAEESMISAAREVKEKVGKECGVSGDGSWQRRGFASLNGVVTVISVDTGKILDTEIISKICHTCKAHEKDDKTSDSYVAWKERHTAVCEADFQGSSGSMEPVGAARIFLRSVKKRGLEYTEFYGDGDSKAYKTVVDADPYNGKQIHKKECIGHYQKRLGTALRKAAKDHKLGGKNKLTAVKIDKMQNYFGIALRENTSSIETMQKGIWASLYHLAARDDQPLHSKCPVGDTSWCSYQKAKATGNLEGYKHKVGLPLDIVRIIKPIYERLTCTEMLAKCLHGKTQNANESFNGMIWKRCPKEIYVGKTTLNLGVMDAVCHFNCGSQVEMEILRRLSIVPGKYMAAGVAAADKLRIAVCGKQAKDATKKRRRWIRSKSKRKSDKATAAEGPMYAAGGFDG